MTAPCSSFLNCQPWFSTRSMSLSPNCSSSFFLFKASYFFATLYVVMVRCWFNCCLCHCGWHLAVLFKPLLSIVDALGADRIVVVVKSLRREVEEERREEDMSGKLRAKKSVRKKFAGTAFRNAWRDGVVLLSAKSDARRHDAEAESSAAQNGFIEFEFPFTHSTLCLLREIQAVQVSNRITFHTWTGTLKEERSLIPCFTTSGRPVYTRREW